MDEALIALLVAVVGSGATWLTIKVTRRKVDAEGTKIIVDTAVALLAPVNTQLQQLRERVAVLEAEIAAWKHAAALRAEQVVQMGGIPIPFEEAERDLRSG